MEEPSVVAAMARKQCWKEHDDNAVDSGNPTFFLKE
jgi:hypothetical protein